MTIPSVPLRGGALITRKRLRGGGGCRGRGNGPPGPRGRGRRSAARLVARGLDCGPEFSLGPLSPGSQALPLPDQHPGGPSACIREQVRPRDSRGTTGQRIPHGQPGSLLGQGAHTVRPAAAWSQEPAQVEGDGHQPHPRSEDTPGRLGPGQSRWAAGGPWGPGQGQSDFITGVSCTEAGGCRHKAALNRASDKAWTPGQSRLGRAREDWPGLGMARGRDGVG